MFHELKTRSPAPWIEHFSDVASLLTSLKSEIINQLYIYLREREKEADRPHSYLLGNSTKRRQRIRQRIAEALNADLVSERDALQAKLGEIDGELQRIAGASREKIANLEQEKRAAEARLSDVVQQVSVTRNLLAHSAVKDVVWLDHTLARTMMPKQPSRVPFHNSAEVALRGYHAAAGARIKPALSTVTWEKLPDHEGGLHRGYHAGIIFHGSNFVPGVTWTTRRCGVEGQCEPGNAHPWHLPNIYWGNYLEVSASDDPIENRLSWRDYEFQVRNPEGQMSEWVKFSYPFDDELLETIRVERLQKGRNFSRQGSLWKPSSRCERLMFSRIVCSAWTMRKPCASCREWEQVRDEAALAKLRFPARGTSPRDFRSGSRKIRCGDRLLLNHVHAYLIHPAEGEPFQASDAQVESAPERRHPTSGLRIRASV